MRACVAALFIAGVAGCTELPALDEPCGNGAIDRGEDCDNDSPTCDEQCRLLCPGGYDSECASAGTVYRCGADHVCHAPSGVFRSVPSTTFPYTVNQGTSADFDGDKIGDIIGFSDVNIDVRFGDLDGTATTRSTSIVPFSTAALSLRRVPGNPGNPITGEAQTPDTADLLLPSPDGVAGFTGRNKSVVAYPFANSPGERGACATVNDTAEPRETFALDKHHLAFITRYKDKDQDGNPAPKAGRLVLAVINPDQSCTQVDLCNLGTPVPEGGNAGVTFDHYEVPTGLPGQLTSVIAVTSSRQPVTMMTTQLDACVVRFDDNGTFSVSTPQSLVVGPGPVALARGTGTALCPALYTAHLNPTGQMEDIGIDYYPETASPCQIQTTRAGQFLSAGQIPAGHIPLVPAPLNSANLYEPDVLAVARQEGLGGSTSFFSLVNGALAATVYTTARPLYPVRFADIDHDNVIEGIGTVAPVGNEGQPNIDILYRTNVSSSNVGFISYRIATQVAPTFIDFGDFDGNSITDIAYTEKLGVRDRLMIAYGTRDRPLDPIEIATFTNVQAMSLIDVSDSIDPFGSVIDDLLIIDVVPIDRNDPSKQTPLLALLHGNTQRSMLAYYDPRAVTGRDFRSSRFVATLAGTFVTHDNVPPMLDLLIDDNVPDLLAFEFEPGGGNVGVFTTHLWIAPGSPFSSGFLDPLANPIETTLIGSGECPPSVALCLNSSTMIPWHLDDSNRDIVLATDAPVFAGGGMDRPIVTIDPLAPEPVHVNPDTELPIGQPVISMFGNDYDGTGVRRLIFSMPVLPQLVQMGVPAQNEVRICDVDGVGHVANCRSLTEEVPELAAYECASAETGRIGNASRFFQTPEVDGFVVLCSAGTEKAVFRVHPVDGRIVADRIIVNEETVPSYVFLSIGDLNGDFADDIVGVAFDPVTQLARITVHLQCEAHDIECIDNRDNRPLQVQP